MSIPLVAPIELTPAENEFAVQLNLNSTRRVHGDTLTTAGAVASRLMESLLERQAIPDIRMRYFTDPELNIGGRGRSRKQVFEDNGRHGSQIFRDGNFLKHLRYFVYGPELPSAVITRFQEKVGDCQLITSGDILPLADLARSLLQKSKPATIDAAEEVFKLALECGLTFSESRLIRDRVKRRLK
jgi:hypothetical protein